MTDQWYPIETATGEYVLLTDGDNVYGGEWDDDHWNIGVADYDPSNWWPTHWKPVSIPENIKNQERWYQLGSCYLISSRGFAWSTVVNQIFDLRLDDQVDPQLENLINQVRLNQ